MLKLDPRTLIISAMCVSLTAVFVRDVRILSIVLYCTLRLALLVDVNPLNVIYRLRHFLILIVFTSLLQSIFVRSGQVLLAINGFPLITSGGLLIGLTVLMRMAILLISGTITASCGAKKGIQGLIQMRIPYEIAFMVYISIHFLPMLSQEMSDSVTAIQLRGVDFKRIPFSKRMKIYTYLFLPVIASTIVKAREISASMELRGFRAGKRRTALERVKMKVVDYLVCCVFVFVMVGCLVY
jgi:energy-coupling factor transport system permease protein